MLHINLLPPYISEGKKKKRFIAIWSLVSAGTVAFFLFTLTGLNAKHAEEKEKETTASNFKAEHDRLEGKIGEVNKAIAEIKMKQDFIGNAQVYNDSWRPGFVQVRDIVNPRIVLKAVSFDPSRSAVNMDAFAPSELDAIKWWMVLLNQTDKFTNVNITLPPHGYQPGGGTAATGAAPGGGGGSMGGGFGARSSGMQGMGGGGSMGARGGAMGGGNAGGGTASGSEGVLEGRTGFDFVCTAGLVKPLEGGPVAPSWAGPNAGGAGGMAPGGMMGGSMGMMGGGMGGSMGGGNRAAAPQ